MDLIQYPPRLMAAVIAAAGRLDQAERAGDTRALERATHDYERAKAAGDAALAERAAEAAVKRAAAGKE